MDQAENLRNMVNIRSIGSSVRIIAITSGKGGVGKTNIVASLALAFSDLDKRVLVFDADAGLANIDILLGIVPKYNLQHVLKREKNIFDIIVKGPGGIEILPAASGVQELSALTEEQRLMIQEEFEALFGKFDVILLDTAAGISSNVTYFCAAAHEIVVIASPEPTSITDAYALMKVLYNDYAQKKFRLLVNSARSEKEAKEVYRHLSAVADKFLTYISIDYVGFILADENIPRAVRQQRAFLEIYPKSRASLCITDIAKRFL